MMHQLPMTLKVEKAFAELLQVAIGNRVTLSEICSAEEWDSVYVLCKNHALLGIGFCGLTKLPKEQRPSRPLIVRWNLNAAKIRSQNKLVLDECELLVRLLDEAGFRACVLKGQSNYLNYPAPLRDFRTSGDIDILSRPREEKNVEDGITRSVLHCIHEAQIRDRKLPHVTYHHADLEWDGKTNVEFHYRATFLCSFVRNKRLQTWLENNHPWGNVADIAGREIPIPSNGYNAVYQLLHIYKHLFEEGIGLRQILDYYFVLVAFHRECEMGKASMSGNEVVELLDSFGMKNLVGAMMYVLDVFFLVPRDCMLCPPDEREGKFLMKEILLAGNFGKSDTRINHTGGSARHAVEKLKHNFRLIGHYPEAVLMEPLFRVYHWFWRKEEHRRVNVLQLEKE